MYTCSVGTVFTSVNEYNTIFSFRMNENNTRKTGEIRIEEPVEGLLESAKDASRHRHVFTYELHGSLLVAA